jgi:hypothetical protein
LWRWRRVTCRRAGRRESIRWWRYATNNRMADTLMSFLFGKVIVARIYKLAANPFSLGNLVLA